MTPRGQGTVELALGSMVFVTVLIFGIHFAEIGFMSLKVQEAANSATWDTTALRAHAYRQAGTLHFNANQLRDPAGDDPSVRATRRYRNFDGRASQLGSGNVFAQVFTRGSQLRVDCEPRRVAPWALKGALNHSIDSAVGNARFNGTEVDGMGCTASAELDRINFPVSFLDDRAGFFEAKHDESRHLSIRVCAVGRPRNGSCEGQIMLALDDYGFAGKLLSSEGASEWNECSDDDCKATPYYDTVKRLYLLNGAAGGSAASSLANFVSSGNTPLADENFFFFEYHGEYQHGIQPHDAPHGPYPTFANQHPHESFVGGEFPAAWYTTPHVWEYATAYSQREQCFLGSRCNSDLF